MTNDQEFTLKAVSPLDGRYSSSMPELSVYFSELALIKVRVSLELEWLIFLGDLPEFTQLKPFNAREKKRLRQIASSFHAKEARQVKIWEQKLNHDVKAVEKFVQGILTELQLTEAAPFVHFCLTSEDINSAAYGLLFKNFITDCWQKEAAELLVKIDRLYKKNKKIPMVARTHGQLATPTTMGKELAVFYHRLLRQNKLLKKQDYLAKFSGTSGNFNAHYFIHPKINWPAKIDAFLKGLKLQNNHWTTQIEPHDFLAELFHSTIRWNSILIDFCRDLWGYIALGYFKQIIKPEEVGSSVMPHKVNPINFENAEGNLGIANSLFGHLAQKLPLSRWQRDLTDSTALRNVGVAFGHSYLALKSIKKGLNQLVVDENQLKKELSEAWELLAEPLQTCLRASSKVNAYEYVKNKVRGKKLSASDWQNLVKKADISAADKKRLLQLTPAKYIGYSDL